LEGGGLDIKDMKDAFIDVRTTIDDLEKEGKILVIKAKDNSPKLFYWNDMSHTTDMDQGINMLI